MKAIIIGAGRGTRLMPLTEGLPKCMACVGHKPILDWGIEAFRASKVEEIVFIGGYRLEKIRKAYPGLKFYHNRDWENNNILSSLFCAEPEMDSPFICAYSDILYQKSIVKKLMESTAAITLAVDVDWRKRYKRRTEHPESEAEKVLVEEDRVVEIGRHVDSDMAYAEYIGAAKFSNDGADILRRHYRRVLREYDGRPFQFAPSVQKAYLIDMFRELITNNVQVHKIDTVGGYMEVDTTQDYKIALKEWR